MFKKSIASATMLGVVFFALASTGGGKKKSATPNPAFTPVSPGVFTMRSNPHYAGSQFLKTINLKNETVYKSVITYQKGNTIYVVPSQYRMNNQSKISFASRPSFRSNLNLLDLRLNLHR